MIIGQLNKAVKAIISPDLSYADDRAFVAVYMNRRVAHLARHFVIARRMLTEAEVSLLGLVEAIWAKQGARLIALGHRLFFKCEGIVPERYTLKILALGLKIVELQQLLFEVAVLFRYRGVLLNKHKGCLLQFELLLLKLHHLIPQGFDGSIDELLDLRLVPGGNVLDALRDFRNATQQSGDLFASREKFKKAHSTHSPSSTAASVAEHEASANGAGQ